MVVPAGVTVVVVALVGTAIGIGVVDGCGNVAAIADGCGCDDVAAIADGCGLHVGTVIVILFCCYEYSLACTGGCEARGVTHAHTRTIAYYWQREAHRY